MFQRHAGEAGRLDRPVVPERPDRDRRRERGSTLLMALLVLAAMSILATTAIVTSMGERNLSRYERSSVQALGAAETGVAYAKRAIVERTAPLDDADGDGRPDFELTDSLAWGGWYRVVAEASDIKGLGITAYQANGYCIVSEGGFQGAHRRVKVEIVHDTFLKFARFVSVNDLNYACGAIITGEAYTGGNLGVPCGCGPSSCQFLESVYVVGEIPNAACATFHRGYVTDAEPIDLGNSFDWTDVRNKARGLAAQNACEGKGSVGIYTSLPGTDPMGLNAQAAPNTGVLVLDRLDFFNTTLNPDTVITYNGNPITNSVTGGHLLYRDFNGIVFFEGDSNTRGTMNGVSGCNMTVYATNRNIIRGDIITGHSGFDPVTRLPNGTGDPVNLGLVAENQVRIDKRVNRILRIDAALLSRTTNWGGQAPSLYPPPGGEYNSMAGLGPMDLDLDGIIGETPLNNDPGPGEGWDELTITSSHWILNINGPIITVSTGDATPWNSAHVLGLAGARPTRRYNYDMDITEYPPPCFPVPLNLWKDVSWSEIFEVATPLASHLPN